MLMSEVESLVSKVPLLLREPVKCMCTTTDVSLPLPPYFLSELPVLQLGQNLLDLNRIELSQFVQDLLRF